MAENNYNRDTIKDSNDEEDIKKEKRRLRIQAEAKKEYDKEVEEQEAYRKKLNLETSKPVETYSVKATDLTNNKSKKAAIRELEAMQRNCISDYKTWAKKDVTYSIAGDVNQKDKQQILAQKLKSYNDAYTVGMMTSCLSPLQEGIDAQTLIQTWFSYKMIDAMNPSMSADKSRMYLNLRDSLMPMAENSTVFAPLVSAADNMILNKSGEQLNDAVAKSLDSDSLDSLVMTPRQLAAIKLNFMEQYYVDMRSVDQFDDERKKKLDDMKDKYNTSMKHIQAIAENSGYDMSVVASEERYLVGIKMAADEDSKYHYENVFNETHSIYGVRPSVESFLDSGDASWQGDFVSADEHEYTATMDDYNGSFTVREPLNTNTLADFKEGLCRQGQQYAWMQQYTESSVCPLSDENKEAVLSELKGKYDDYEKRVISQLQDDLGYSKEYAKELFDETFTAGKDEQLAMTEAMPFEAVEDLSASGLELPPGTDFYREVQYTIEKEAFRQLGTDITAADKGVTRTRELDLRNNILSTLSVKSKQYYEDRGESDERDREELARDMTKNWIENLSSKEYTALMMHAGGNMEQGYAIRGVYSRHGEPSVQDGYNEELDSLEQGGTNGQPSERELPDVPESGPTDGLSDGFSK
jgi:hypothetical protein